MCGLLISRGLHLMNRIKDLRKVTSMVIIFLLISRDVQIMTGRLPFKKAQTYGFNMHEGHGPRNLVQRIHFGFFQLISVFLIIILPEKGFGSAPSVVTSLLMIDLLVDTPKAS